MFCPQCGSKNDDNAYRCTSCGAVIQEAPAQRVVTEEYPQELGLIIPIGVSGLSIIAGYLGLFAVLLVPAPFALIFGILALKDIKQNPKKKGMGRAIFGIIMGALGSIGLLAIGIAAISH